MADRFGAVTWWGFSPALDLLDEGVCCGLERLGIEQRGEGKEINILLIGSGDIRHILKTMAFSHRHGKPRIRFFIIESSLEVLARHMLLLSLVFEQPDRLGLQEKAELFLELHGNSLIRQQTFDYLKAKCDQFIRFATNLDYMAQKLRLVDLSQLKFKERDLLEGVFKFWRNCDQGSFPVVELWEQRLRHGLKTRFDARQGVFDWDYSMKLQDKASIVYSREYKNWRETGIAFAFREGGYDVPNRTLASGLIVATPGGKIAQRGYWGDVVNSPYIALGIETERAELMKKVNDRHVKLSGDVAMYNVTAYIHELLTGTRYIAVDQTGRKEERSGGQATIEEVEEEAVETEVVRESESVSGQEKKSSTVEDTEFLHPLDVTVVYLPMNSAQEIHKKSKYHRLFDIVYFSNSMVHNLTGDIQIVFAPGASIVIETTKFMLELKKELSEDYVKKVTGMAHTAGCKILKPCNGLADAHAFFKYEQ